MLALALEGELVGLLALHRVAVGVAGLQGLVGLRVVGGVGGVEDARGAAGEVLADDFRDGMDVMLRPDDQDAVAHLEDEVRTGHQFDAGTDDARDRDAVVGAEPEFL